MNALVDRWFYLVVTWHPTSGIVLYQDANVMGSSAVGKAVSGLPQNEDIPNFGVGRPVGSPGRVCGKFYLNSLVVFKQFLTSTNVMKIYTFFWTNSKFCA